MSWFDIFDDIFRGSSNNNSGGSFSQFALSEFAATVPYIGAYLGFYLTGYEDLSELTDIPETTSEEPLTSSDFGPGHSMLSDSGLLADNSQYASQELMLDTGPALRLPAAAPPKHEPVQEVFIRAPHPDRSRPVMPSPPRRMPPPPRPETQALPREERQQPVAFTTNEIIITAEPLPFNREVSDPEALAQAEGRGRIEWADLAQMPRGGFNGLIAAWQQLAHLAVRSGVYDSAGPVLGPILSPIAESPIDYVSKYRLSIDPRHGAGGLIGEKLMENLVFEALPFAPQLAGAIGKGRALSGATRVYLPAANPADTARLEAALEEITYHKAISEDIILSEHERLNQKPRGLEKPASGWLEAEVQSHLDRLSKQGSSLAKHALEKYTEAIRNLAAIPRVQGREIFRDIPKHL